MSAWMRRRARLALNRVRQLLRMDLRTEAVEARVTLEATANVQASGEVRAQPDSTIAEKVAFLLRRDQDGQRHLNRLAERVGIIETETPRRLEQLGDELKAHVERQLTVVAEAYRPLRIVGTIALALGLLAVTIATFA